MKANAKTEPIFKGLVKSLDECDLDDLRQRICDYLFHVRKVKKCDAVLEIERELKYQRQTGPIHIEDDL